MSLVSMKQLLDKAQKEKYAIGAFNAINTYFLEAILSAAKAKNKPVILNIAEVHYPFIDVEMMTDLCKYMSRKKNVDVALNLDHGLSYKSCMNAIKLGFTSVMFDGSALPYEENIRTTKEIVKACKAVNVSVEGELGAIGGAEGGALSGTANPDLFTNVDQAKEFVTKTGIDALAVSIGNVHGKYKGEPNLDFERLEQINNAVGIPLVLHGGSGISDEDFRRAISLGICKINYFTGMSESAINSLENNLRDRGKNYNQLPEWFIDMQTEVQHSVEKQIELFANIQYVQY